jgi:hypothetical protein
MKSSTAVTKKKLINPELSKPFGKTTHCKLVWQDWKTLPKSGDRIFVIVRIPDGYHPYTGIYLDEILPATGRFPASRWQQVRFDEYGLPTIFFGDKNHKRLIAWAKLKLDGPILS